jgi:hypothetical protein
MTVIINFVWGFGTLAGFAFGLYWIIRSAIEDAG